MKRRKKLDLLVEIYMERGQKRGLGALTDFERPLRLVRPFSYEMIGGGFRDFFEHPPGAYAARTVDALRRIGARSSALLLEEAIRGWRGGGGNARSAGTPGSIRGRSNWPTARVEH